MLVGIVQLVLGMVVIGGGIAAGVMAEERGDQWHSGYGCGTTVGGALLAGIGLLELGAGLAGAVLR